MLYILDVEAFVKLTVVFQFTIGHYSVEYMFFSRDSILQLHGEELVQMLFQIIESS